MDIYTTTIAISLLVYIAIGNYAGRGIRKLDDYFVAGRRAPTLFIVGTLVASVISSVMFLGEAGFAYDTQAGPYVLFPQAATIGYIFGALFFGRYLRRSRTTTVAEFFGQRFASKRVQALAGLTIIVALGGYLLAVTQGAAILLSELTRLSYVQALAVSWVSYTAFTMYSGSRGVILTDTLMFLLFTLASAAAAIYMVNQLGGVPDIVRQLANFEKKPELLSWHGIVGPGTSWPTAIDYLIWAIVVDVSWMLVYMVSPWQASRHLMAKNEHVVMRSAMIAALVIVVLQVLVYGMGGAINLANPDIEPQKATIWAALNMLPALLGAIMLAGIMAAALSSASTFLSLVGFSASNDIGIRHGGDERKILRFSRLIMLVIGAVVLVLALVFPPKIFWLSTFIATFFASAWGPVGLMCIWSKRITEAAAFWGMLAGMVFNAVPKLFQTFYGLYLPSWLDPMIIGAVASLLVTVMVSRRTKVSRAEAEYLEHLHQRPVDEIGPRRTRVTLYVPIALLLLHGITMPWLLTQWYVRPYQEARGMLTADGSLNLWTGEMALMASWCVVWIGISVFAYRYIKRSYGSG